jgi:Domain of unknown function (DUF4262)
MCWWCEHPKAKWPDYLDHMRDLIRRFGWAVQAVERSGLHPPWSYSVGLTEVGCPELVATGLSAVRAMELLDDVASHLMHSDTVLTPGEQIPLVGGPLIEIVQLPEPSAHLRVATELYGMQISAVQLVHADDRGHWPWEVGYRGVRGGQPVLGPRAARRPNAA